MIRSFYLGLVSFLCLIRLVAFLRTHGRGLVCTLAFATTSQTGCDAFEPAQHSAANRQILVIPTDERGVIEPNEPPQPILGATLLTVDGSRDTVALGSVEDVSVLVDPARNRLSVIPESVISESGMPEAASDAGVHHMSFQAGDLPFRATRVGQDIYVVLRGAGTVAHVQLSDSGDVTAEGDSTGNDPTNRGANETSLVASLEGRFPVCAQPRGIDFDSLSQQLVVACAEGKLVRLNLAGEIESSLDLPVDLRDVVVQSERTYVSRFRTAEVLIIEDNQLLRTLVPETIRTQSLSGFESPDGDVERVFKPSVAWKMIAHPDGGVVMSHQRALTNPVGVELHSDDTFQLQTSSPYGGGDNAFRTCGAIVQSAVTRWTPQGVTLSSPHLDRVVLAVDLAVHPETGEIAVASAGLQDEEMPRQRQEVVEAPSGIGSTDFVELSPTSDSAVAGRGSVALLRSDELHRSDHFTVQSHPCLIPTMLGGGPTTAVGFSDAGNVQSFERQPAVLSRVSRVNDPIGSLPLGGDAVLSTGHEIFHRDSGGGLACASCHPEAGDDGHVWHFEGLGPRRTQHLGIPLEDTAPFHWDGSLADMNELMDLIFAQRMGGVFQSPERLDSLSSWLFARKSTAVAVDDESSRARGEELFYSADTQCGSCHSGGDFTDNHSYDVGTADGQRLQVPPLRALLLRPPYMHNGCAETLRDRFEDECGGGDSHGKTSHLSDREVDDLVTYLKSL